MTLKFEHKWQKTISSKDRKLIIQTYMHNPIQEETVLFAPVRAARNHRGDLLATVLIVNGYQSEWKLHERILHYYEKGIRVAENKFTHPSLIIPPQCAMPWTFIFHSNSLKKIPILADWQIIFL
ncbi:SLAP domain-containing protein [Guptibacillus algicola]|uniref:SLAP domain-containing protein n=1 Tax=Guptibacillus algicola TaxID=225844 RepID=UPI001CD6E11A|nr:SLAP domain-containing protein [Alkalihalobacillus algicola]MCA0988868.1 SLAP domain-containing protein [Alkalihalobacillus algicola]